MEENKKKTQKNLLKTSILLSMMALVALTAVTVAWFSIADNARVRTMSLELITGVDLRMDLDPHETIEEYVKTLTFEDISQRILEEKGFSMEEVPLEPVTTSDYERFTYENGTVVEPTSGAYLEFTLHFMGEKDMLVHLTEENSSEDEVDGTAVNSKNPELPQAMRIAFTADGKTTVYDPGENRGEDLFLFSLKKEEDKEVQVHIWLEGTDPACTDVLRNADYEIRLRFNGTDLDGKPFSQE
ncbi:MAG: hypothetical protein SOR88_08515 [Roseburia inulinivorans]|nr:hypothetical protein [Roseburia inulinivorans]